AGVGTITERKLARRAPTPGAGQREIDYEDHAAGLPYEGDQMYQRIGLADVLKSLDSFVMFARFVTFVRTFLSGWWRNSDHRPFVLRRGLVIVSRREPQSYADCGRAFFANAPDVEVILDRRHGERRRRAVLPRVDHRRRERRLCNVDGDLLRTGFAMVGW